ncbi:MAG: mannosyltransferase family protein [Dehalococcoidia bacterium]
MTALSLPRVPLPDVRGGLIRIGIGPEAQRWILRAALLALGIRIALLIAGYVTGYIIIGREGPGAQDIILETFKRWDAASYERIAENGYPPPDGEYPEIIVFLPLFPYLVHVVEWIIPSFLVAGMLISAIASVAAGYFIQGIVRYDGADDAEASRALWYFFLFPTAYFLAMPYTEALFMALLLGSFYYARRGNWLMAAMFGAFCTATRLQGMLLLPALIVEAVHQKNWRGVDVRALWLAIVPWGFVVYLLINWDIHGDPFAFVDFEDQYWFHHRIWPWESVREAYEWTTEARPDFIRVSIYEFRLAATALAVVILGIGAFWLRPSYQVFAWLSLLLFLSVSFQISMPRYILTIFPMYFVMAHLGRNLEAHQTMLTMSAVLMGAFYVVYATRWGF